MTDTQKNKIKELRLAGYGYKRIAGELCISVDTVKSFCRRNDVAATTGKVIDSSADGFCRQCRAKVKQTPGKKKKQYCSDKCRMDWWNAHPELLQRTNKRTFVCNTCGISFDGYGKRERKYCSRDCYAKSKAVN